MTPQKEEDSHMSSLSPEHPIIEEYKLFAEKDPLLQDSPSQHDDDEDYNFLATASLIESQASPNQHYRGSP